VRAIIRLVFFMTGYRAEEVSTPILVDTLDLTKLEEGRRMAIEQKVGFVRISRFFLLVATSSYS